MYIFQACLGESASYVVKESLLAKTTNQQLNFSSAMATSYTLPLPLDLQHFEVVLNLLPHLLVAGKDKESCNQ